MKAGLRITEEGQSTRSLLPRAAFHDAALATEDVMSFLLRGRSVFALFPLLSGPHRLSIRRAINALLLLLLLHGSVILQRPLEKSFLAMEPSLCQTHHPPLAEAARNYAYAKKSLPNCRQFAAFAAVNELKGQKKFTVAKDKQKRISLVYFLLQFSPGTDFH
jgi:hypothetical protein